MRGVRGSGRARSALLPLLLVSSALTSIQAAHAQIETVVVTAEKRAENLQNVPFSITALTTE
jgi:iron complex outermembrane recepter protein